MLFAKLTPWLSKTLGCFLMRLTIPGSVYTGQMLCVLSLLLSCLPSFSFPLFSPFVPPTLYQVRSVSEALYWDPQWPGDATDVSCALGTHSPEQTQGSWVWTPLLLLTNHVTEFPCLIYEVRIIIVSVLQDFLRIKWKNSGLVQCLTTLNTQWLPTLTLLIFLVMETRNYNTKQSVGKVQTVLERPGAGRFHSVEDREVQGIHAGCWGIGSTRLEGVHGAMNGISKDTDMMPHPRRSS